MAWEHLITADAFDNQIFSAISNSGHVTRSTLYARTGNYSFHIGGASILDGIASLVLYPATSKYVAFSLANNNHDNSNWLDVMEGATVHVRMLWSTAAAEVRVFLGPGTTLLATIPGLAPEIVNFYDMFFLIDDTEGRIVIKDANGAILVDYTGDTRNGGTSGVINKLQWTAFSNIPGTSRIYLDDIAVRSDDFCGPGGNYVRTAVANGDDDDWTASAGQPFECVDEIPPTMADYILANSGDSGARATFQGSSPEGLAVIDTVGVYALAQLEFAGAGRILPVAKSGASYAQGEAQGVGTSETWIKSFFDADPNTAAPWSKNAVLASQFGVEVA